MTATASASRPSTHHTAVEAPVEAWIVGEVIGVGEETVLDWASDGGGVGVTVGEGEGDTEGDGLGVGLFDGLGDVDADLPGDGDLLGDGDVLGDGDRDVLGGGVGDREEFDGLGVGDGVGVSVRVLVTDGRGEREGGDTDTLRLGVNPETRLEIASPPLPLQAAARRPAIISAVAVEVRIRTGSPGSRRLPSGGRVSAERAKVSKVRTTRQDVNARDGRFRSRVRGGSLGSRASLPSRDGRAALRFRPVPRLRRLFDDTEVTLAFYGSIVYLAEVSSLGS